MTVPSLTLIHLLLAMSVMSQQLLLLKAIEMVLKLLPLHKLQIVQQTVQAQVPMAIGVLM